MSGPAENGAAAGTGKSRGRRRAAVRLSRVDAEAVERGGLPAWDQVRQLEVDPRPEVEPKGESARDRQLRAEVPPHW